MHEALKVVSAKSPTLIDALRHAKDANNLFVCLDGTLIRTDRVASKNPKNRHDLWYSGKHKAFGGNVQVLTDENGYPLWVSPVSPASTHDITAAREHVLEVISTVDIRVLTDKGYIGAGHNVHTPIRGRNLADQDYEYNRRLNGLRAPSERANDMLKQLKALSTCNPMPEGNYDHSQNRICCLTPQPQQSW
ncbi:transposase family protein [Corynebacterium sp.]|uniref:transposase family protein n=1 Tax=Corynebacterium sp. TaxID=1720 RepID=UPI0034C6567D